MNFKKTSVFMLSLVLATAIILSGCSSGGGSTDEIKIGVTGPLSGSTANSGVAIKEGMQLAIDEWNEKGGVEVDGEKRKIKMIYEDNQGKPEEGVSVAQKLFNNDNVDFLIGDSFSSSVTMAIMDLASQYEKPIMSGEPVSQAISDKVKKDPEKYKYFWKADYNSSAYGESVYYTVESTIKKGLYKPKNKKVAFVVEDTDYGRSNADEARKMFEKAGWEVTDFETVKSGHTDFYPQLNKLKGSDPSVLVSCFTAVSSGVAYTKQYKESGLAAMSMGIYYPVRPEFIQQAKSDADGVLFTPILFDPTLRPNQKDFANKIAEKYDIDPTVDHAYGYDEMQLALNSISKAKSVDADKIVEQLSKTSLDGLLGKYVFDQNTHTIKSGPGFIQVPGGQIQNEKGQITWPDDAATADYVTQPWLEK